MMPTRPRRGDPPVFHLVLIKPTHYDDDGYPIRWVKAAIPSNTPACLNGLAEDAARRQVLGPGVGIRFHTFDETNQRVRPARIIRAIRKARGRALIGLVGVQSNQFPRAVDLARPFRAAGLPVCIGGFHVSGTIAMLPQMTLEMVEARALGISFFAGEAEDGRLGQVMRDASGDMGCRAEICWSFIRSICGRSPSRPGAIGRSIGVLGWRWKQFSRRPIGRPTPTSRLRRRKPTNSTISLSIMPRVAERQRSHECAATTRCARKLIRAAIFRWPISRQRPQHAS
jgi:hypothetical protein